MANEEANKQESWGAKAKNLLTANNTRVNNFQLALMLVVAFLIDGIQIIMEWLVVGLAFSWIPTILGTLIFFFWFTLNGISFVGPKKIFTFLGSFLIDIIPGSDALVVTSFNWVVAVLILVAISRAEDLTGVKIPLKPQELKPGNLKKPPIRPEIKKRVA